MNQTEGRSASSSQTHTPARSNAGQVYGALSKGERLTARQIAEKLGTTPRQVQVVVCNAVNAKHPWITREKPDGYKPEYVYFLTTTDTQDGTDATQQAG